MALHLDDEDILSGGYTYPLGEMADGELGPHISMDVESGDGECWLVSAEGGRSLGKAPLESDTNRWVASSADGYWASITIARSEA